MNRSFVLAAFTFYLPIIHMTSLYTCETPSIKMSSLKKDIIIPAARQEQEKLLADSFTIGAIASHLIPHKNNVGITTQETATNLALAWPPQIISTTAGKIAPSYRPERKEFRIKKEHLKIKTPARKIEVPKSPTPLSPTFVPTQEPEAENTINELGVLAAINNLQNNGTLTTPTYSYKNQPSGPILGYIQWPPKLILKNSEGKSLEPDKPKDIQEKFTRTQTPITYSEIDQLYQSDSCLIPIYKSYLTKETGKSETTQRVIRPIKKEFLCPQDGSKLLGRDTTGKIYIFDDPKNKIRIAITSGRTPHDNIPQLTYPLCYAQRVLDWHNDPEQTLIQAKEKNEYAEPQNIMQHNFAFAIDKQLMSFGVITIWEHPKWGYQVCILIPAAIISVKTKKGKPVQEIKPYILTYTFSNKKNKEWLFSQHGEIYDTDHLYHRCAVHLDHSSVLPYGSILKKASSLATWCQENQKIEIA